MENMADELKLGEYIEVFVSDGPKNYAYRIDKLDSTKELKTVCKVREITLNYTTSQLVNSDVINPLNVELDPIRHLLALVGARHIVHVSRIRVKSHPPFASIGRSSPYCPR